ncbi:hypothetical protein [Pseudobythopirellula maris]|uniref:hypothetical protein n=1 Tax=Pseudobythopirellula maris TaxID=2527991 RepID=UPI0018D48245|nr:hypothetical protein [Pseudobythopirellula maris]
MQQPHQNSDAKQPQHDGRGDYLSLLQEGVGSPRDYRQGDASHVNGSPKIVAASEKQRRHEQRSGDP